MQTYSNYFKEYYKTPNGREAKNRAQRRYRTKLQKQYGGTKEEAMIAHRMVSEKRKAQSS